MNKWIPISLLVFFGIYLLTTARAPVFDYPSIQISTSQAEIPGQTILYPTR